MKNQAMDHLAPKQPSLRLVPGLIQIAIELCVRFCQNGKRMPALLGNQEDNALHVVQTLNCRHDLKPGLPRAMNGVCSSVLFWFC